MFARVAEVPAAAALMRQAGALLGEDVQALAGDARRFDNAIAQPLVCLATLSHWVALRDTLPAPDLVLGYSVGELAAHAIAGSFSAEDCLRLAAERAVLMDANSPADAGLMAVVGLPAGVVIALAATHAVVPAIFNAEDHVVVGGARKALEVLRGELEAQGARVVALPVEVPSHTHWLQPAAQAFARVLQALPPRPPALRVLAGIDGQPVVTAEGVVQALSMQIARPLHWQQAMQQARERGARVFLELGPGAALSKMARDIDPACQARSVEEFRSLSGVAEWVSAALERAA
jgi:[acyl-carrier-protein] S-malonyltransferase